eukprot:COSAG02_NODE_45322_length_358_cov_0.803089_1_plen_99_part_01
MQLRLSAAAKAAELFPAPQEIPEPLGPQKLLELEKLKPEHRARIAQEARARELGNTMPAEEERARVAAEAETNQKGKSPDLDDWLEQIGLSSDEKKGIK